MQHKDKQHTDSSAVSGDLPAPVACSEHRV